MAISKEKKKRKARNLPKSSKNLCNAIHNFSPSQCVDCFGNFPKSSFDHVVIP
jgi:hypothetical protein